MHQKSVLHCSHWRGYQNRGHCLVNVELFTSAPWAEIYPHFITMASPKLPALWANSRMFQITLLLELHACTSAASLWSFVMLPLAPHFGQKHILQWWQLTWQKTNGAEKEGRIASLLISVKLTESGTFSLSLSLTLSSEGWGHSKETC